MILTIFGLPQMITRDDLKRIIQEECSISEFVLGGFLPYSKDKKKIKICVSDEIDADLVKKGLGGYKLADNIIYVVRVAPKIHTVKKISVNTESIDNQMTSSVKAYIKVKQFSSENIPRNKKKKNKGKRKQQCLAVKQATMNDLGNQTPILIADVADKRPIQCVPDLPKRPEQSNSIGPTSEHPQEPTPCVNLVVESRKRSQEMTKSDELVLGMLNEKRTMWDVPITTIEEEFLHAVITSGLTGHLCQDAVDLVLKSIQIKLVEDSKVESIYIPVFRKSPIYKDGAVNLFCADQKSFDWLESVVVNPDLMGGMPLTINRVDAKGKLLCAIIIPDRDNILKNPRFILRLLMRQNCWVDVKSWQFVGSEPQPGNYFMKVLIPKEHLDILGSRGRRLAYSISSVYVKFLGQAKKH